MRNINLVYMLIIVILGLIAIAFLAIPGFIGNEKSYQTQIDAIWGRTAGGYTSFKDQVSSLKSSQESSTQVCHLAKVHLQELNDITFPKTVPAKYKDFNAGLINAVDINSHYYRKILQLCSNQSGDNTATISSITSLGNNTDDSYRELARSGVVTTPAMDWNTSSVVNETIAAVFKPKPSPPAKKSASKTFIIHSPPIIVRPVPEPKEQAKEEETNYNAFTPEDPPDTGSIVYVDTPKGGGLKLRERASTSAERVAEQSGVIDGEGLLVLDRVGDWLQVQTDQGNIGYVRWWYRGDCYVRP